MNRRAADPRASRRRRGFTLLEILLTLGLMLVLLASLWSLFNVFSRLFETAPVKAAQGRLVAGIVQQLADDLRSAIEDSDDENYLAGTEPVRRFGLVGTANSLRVDVLQVVAADRLPPLDGSSPDVLGPAAPHVPELRTIVYRCTAGGFEEPDDGQQPNAAKRAVSTGLARWEIDFETPEDPTAGPPPGSSPAETADDGDPAGMPPADSSATWIPEIEGLEFRYFDGSSWSGSWSSLDRKSLPVAIEVSLRVRDPEMFWSLRGVASANRAGSPDAANDYLWAADAAGGGAGHRFVIQLPGAKARPMLHSPEVAFAPSAPEPMLVAPIDLAPVEVPAARVPPPVVPQPAVPAAAVNPDRSNQWMRP